MNYLKEILAFESWIETNQISPTAQLLWYKLIAINNSCGWQQWFTVSNTTLMAKMNVTDKTLDVARKALVESGRIQYVSGKHKRIAGTYYIIPLSETTTGNIPVNPPVKSPVEDETTPQTTGNIPLKRGTLNKLNKTEVVEVEEVGDSPPKNEEIDLNDVLDYYIAAAAKDICSPNDREVANSLIREPGMKLEYIKQGIDQSKLSFRKRTYDDRMPFAYCKKAILRVLDKAQRKPVKLNNPQGQGYSNVPQNTNYSQRTYDKKYFDSLYEDV